MNKNDSMKRYREQQEDILEKVSISGSEDEATHTRGPTTTRHLITNNSLNSQLKSFNDMDQFGSSKKMFEGILRKKNKKQSVAYISNQSQHKIFNQLNLKKRFHEDYKENKKLM